MGYEPTTPAFEQTETVHSLDSTATVTGPNSMQRTNISETCTSEFHTAVMLVAFLVEDEGLLMWGGIRR
jgi:hypothetical protein